MRLARYAVAGIVCLPNYLWAQTPPGGVYVGGAPQPTTKTCVQVQIAGQAASSLNCLNQALQQQVQNSGAALPTIPLSANAPSNAVGTFNEQGVRQQYGQNFGKSVIPYRPPPLTYGNPLH